MELYLSQQLMIALCVYIGQVTIGYMGSWVTPIIPKLQDPEQTPLPDVITDEQASLVGSFLFIGVLLCSFAAGHLSNIKGRKLCLTLGGVITLSGQLLILFSVNLPMLLGGRAVMGFGLGFIFNQNLVYLVEIASTNIRGALVTGTLVFTSFGSLAALCIVPFVSYTASCYVGLGIALVFTIGTYFIPESPIFKLLQGKEDEAKAVLETLGRTDEVKDLIVVKDDNNNKINYWKLITAKTTMKTLLILIILFLFTNMSGSIAISIYATFIFNLTNMNLDSNIASIIFGVTLFFSSSISPIFVEKAGRRVLLTVSTALCCIFQALLGLYFFLESNDYPVVKSLQWLPLVSMMAFVVAFNSGFAIIPSALSSEMFASDVRSLASAVTMAFNWLFSFIASLTFGYMTSALGGYITFWIYSGVCAIAFVFSLLFIPETKGKTLVEIEHMLNK